MFTRQQKEKGTKKTTAFEETIDVITNEQLYLRYKELRQNLKDATRKLGETDSAVHFITDYLEKKKTA